MSIDDPTAPGATEPFRARIIARLREQGGRAGFASGESFKLVENL
jgi:hypothetical protein